MIVDLNEKSMSLMEFFNSIELQFNQAINECEMNLLLDDYNCLKENTILNEKEGSNKITSGIKRFLTIIIDNIHLVANQIIHKIKSMYNETNLTKIANFGRKSKAAENNCRSNMNNAVRSIRNLISGVENGHVSQEEAKSLASEIKSRYMEAQRQVMKSIKA